MFRETGKISPTFDAYLAEVGESFCPFLLPARKERLLFFSDCDLRQNSQLAATIFYRGMVHTELLRQKRREQRSTRAYHLLCENVIFHLPEKIGSLKELFAWPHWILKRHYTKVGVMFGKFWQGEEDIARDGRSIPVPPLNFLSIRSAVKPTDGRFFSKAPRLSDDYTHSIDDGKLVWAEKFEERTPKAVSAVETFDMKQASEQIFTEMVEEMLQTSFYEFLRSEAEKELKSHT